MMYQFDADIAALYGVDESIMIANLQFWIRKNEANGKHFYNGRFWTYNSVEAFTRLFPFWTSRQIRRILKSLEEQGVIVTGNYNSSAYDRTTWYAFGDSFLQKYHFHFTDTSNGSDQTGETIICTDINTNIETDNKPNKPADGVLFPADDVESVKHTRRTSESACLFVNSRFADFMAFSAEFKAPEFNDVDILYYFHAVADWSSQNGKKMKDWIATARNFIRRDIEKKKLHRKSPDSGLPADAFQYIRSMAN